MKRILVPSLVAVLLAPLATLSGGEVQLAGGPQATEDTASAVQPVAFLDRVFRRNRGCACQAPSCTTPACEAPSCAAPACGCESSSCCEQTCKSPCDNGLLGRLWCRMQTRRRCRPSRPSCVGCTRPSCGAPSCLAAIRVRRWMGCGCGPALGSCEPGGCCEDPCKNYWGNYCCSKRPSLADAMRMAAARFRARRCCIRSHSGCTSGCCTSSCCTNPGCTSSSGDSIQSPFMDDPDSLPPMPPTESDPSPRARRLKPLGSGSKTAMGTGVKSPGVNVQLKPLAPRRTITRATHTEEILQPAASGSSRDVFSSLAEGQRQEAPQRLSDEQRKAAEIETETATTDEVSALPTLIRFVK